MMEIIHSLEKINNSDIPCVIALGTFDGFHLGHQDVIMAAKLYAQKYNYKLAVFTFTNHPLSLINPKNMPSALITQSEKTAWLKNFGVDILLDIPFEVNLANLSPEDFLKKLLKLDFKCLVVGENFNFGYHGEGNINSLMGFAKKMNFELIVRPLVRYNNVIVSSTVIRQLIKEGNVELANQMLQRKYSISDTVVKGNQRGRLLNFPTANIELSNYDITIPKKGVYAVKVNIGGIIYSAMANVGVNPTFGDVEKVRLEINIFDFHENIYGSKINVEFYNFIRGEKKFASVDELVKQLKQDKLQVTAVLKK